MRLGRRGISGEIRLRAEEYRYGTGRVTEDPAGFYVDPEGWQPHWEYTRRHVREIIHSSRRGGVKVGLFYIPCPQSGIHGDCCRGLYPRQPGLSAEVFSPLQGWLMDLAEEEEVPFAEVTTTLFTLEQQGDTEPVYLIPDGHLNPRGNRLAAEALQPMLLAWVGSERTAGVGARPGTLPDR